MKSPGDIVANTATIFDKKEIDRLYVKPFLIAIENSSVAAYKKKILSSVAEYLNYVVHTVSPLITSGRSLDQQSTLLENAETKLVNVQFKLTDNFMYFMHNDVPLYTAYRPLASFYFAKGEYSDVMHINRTRLRELFFEYIDPLPTFKIDTTQRTENIPDRSRSNWFFSRTNSSSNERVSNGLSVAEKIYYTLGSNIQLAEIPCCVEPGTYNIRTKIKPSLLARSTAFSENQTLKLFPSLYHAIEYAIFNTVNLDSDFSVPSIVAVSYYGNASLDEQITELRNETIMINEDIIMSSSHYNLPRQSMVSFFEILAKDVEAIRVICLTDQWGNDEYFSYNIFGQILDSETLHERLNPTRLGCNIC